MAAIKVNRPCDVVWKIFTNLNSWKVWWGGTLKRINPSWQVGATLEWEAGVESQVFDFNPLKRIVIKGNYGEILTWSFTEDDIGSTLVEMEVDLSTSSLRETNPGALEIKLQSALSELKKYIESTPNFIGLD
jgi:hypothetical protein